MRKILIPALFALSGSVAAQTSSVVSEAGGTPPTPVLNAALVDAPIATLIKHDTPVVLMAVNEVTTDKLKPGTRFTLRVHQAITVDGKTVVPVGTPAYGTVLTASDAGGLGKSGRMTAKLLHIQLGEAEIPLEGAINAKGTGAGSAGVAIVFTGLTGLFHRGNNAKIKAGELLSGFVAEDVALDLSTTTARRLGAPAPPVEATTAP